MLTQIYLVSLGINELNLDQWAVVPARQFPCGDQGPLLLTWFNFNPSMDK